MYAQNNLDSLPQVFMANLIKQLSKTPELENVLSTITKIFYTLTDKWLTRKSRQLSIKIVF